MRQPGAFKFVSENGGRRVHSERNPPPSRYIVEVIRTRAPYGGGMVDQVRISLDIEVVGPWHELAYQEVPVTDAEHHLTEDEVSAIVHDMLARRDEPAA